MVHAKDMTTIPDGERKGKGEVEIEVEIEAGIETERKASEKVIKSRNRKRDMTMKKRDGIEKVLILIARIQDTRNIKKGTRVIKKSMQKIDP